MFEKFHGAQEKEGYFQFQLDQQCMKKSMLNRNQRLSTDVSDKNTINQPYKNISRNEQNLKCYYQQSNSQQTKRVYSLSAKPEQKHQKYAYNIDKHKKNQSGKIRKNKLKLSDTPEPCIQKPQKNQIKANSSLNQSISQFLYEDSLCNRTVTQQNETKYSPTILQILKKYQYPLMKRNKPQTFFGSQKQKINQQKDKQNKYPYYSKIQEKNHEITHQNEKKRLAQLRDISQLELKIKIRMAGMY